MKRIIAVPVISAALRAPVDRRAWSELAYCAAVLPLSVAICFSSPAPGALPRPK